MTKRIAVSSRLVSERLNALPTRETVVSKSLFNLVASIIDDIEEALRRGNTFADVTSIVSELNGTTVNPKSLQTYLSRVRSQKAGGQSKARKSRAKPSLASVSPSPAPPVQAPAVKAVQPRPPVVPAPRQFAPPPQSQPPRPIARPPQKIDPKGIPTGAFFLNDEV